MFDVPLNDDYESRTAYVGPLIDQSALTSETQYVKVASSASES